MLTQHFYIVDHNRFDGGVFRFVGENNRKCRITVNSIISRVVLGEMVEDNS